jgi:predicted aconitase with swiveling domain
MTTNLNSAQQQAILNQVQHLAWLLDNAFEVPIIRYRVGLDALIGLIPVIGDAAGMIISSYIVLQAARLGVSSSVLTRMVVNIVIEAVIGSIPLIGDLFDAVFKANARNMRLLNEVVK